MLVDASAVGTVFPAGQAVFETALALQYRHHGVRHHKVLLLAVGFAHANVQVAAAAGGVKVGDFKRPWRHIALIDNVAVLANDDLGVAARDPAHHRRISFHAVRQDLIFRSQLAAAELHAVEYVAGGGAVAQGQAALQRNDIALQVGINRTP